MSAVASIAKFVLVAAAPLAIHFYALFGSILPSRIRTSFTWFDNAYNALPWLPSLLCGICAAMSLAVWKESQALAYGLMAAAAFLLLIDIVGGGLSFHAHLKGEGRRK